MNDNFDLPAHVRINQAEIRKAERKELIVILMYGAIMLALGWGTVMLTIYIEGKVL